MARKRKTVRQLADEAGMEIDEALVTLWNHGFESISSPDDVLGNQELNRARRALGVATRRELISQGYWTKTLGLTQEEFGALLVKLDVGWNANASRVPAKSVARLKAYARTKGNLLGLPYEKKRLAVKEEPKAFVWATVGKEADAIRYLTEAEVTAIHFALVKDFASSSDPVDPPGVKSKDMLGSAVFRPHTSLGAVRKYGSLESAGAALLYSLVNNHPFHNGNKRTALVALLVFLDENGQMLTCAEDDVFRMLLRIAQHRVAENPLAEPDEEVYEIAKWIWNNSRQVEKGERPIPWRRLKQVLTSYGCTFHPHGQRGTKLQICRTKVVKSGLFGRAKPLHLKANEKHWEDGNDVPKPMVKRIRQALHLDEEHGIDSKAFYGEEGRDVHDFISRYRKTLSRLAKL